MVAGDEMGGRGMEKEARARRRTGLDCEFLSGRELKARYGIARTGAILSQGAATADPVALARGLLRRAKARGARGLRSAPVTRQRTGWGHAEAPATGRFIGIGLVVGAAAQFMPRPTDGRVVY